MPLDRAEVVMVGGTVVAVLAGAVIAVQVRLLGRVSLDAPPHVLGLLVSAAGIVAALVVVTAARDWPAVSGIGVRPDWIFAGALGVVAIAALGVAGARAGTVAALAGSMAGQLVVGAVLDRLG